MIKCFAKSSNMKQLSVNRVLYVEKERSTSTNVIGEYFKYTKSSLDNSSRFPSNLLFSSSPDNISEIRFNVDKPLLFSNTVLNYFFTIAPVSPCND